LWRRRQTRQIQRDSPDERAPVGLGRRREPLPRQSRLNEGVDRIASRGLRYGGPLHRRVGPVPLVLRALGDPLANGVLLGLAQFLVRELRRHNASVLGEDALDDGAALRIARDDGDYAGLPSLERLIANVEPQVGHARILVGT